MLNRREFLAAVSLLPAVHGVVGAAPQRRRYDVFIPEAALTFCTSILITGRAVRKSTAGYDPPTITKRKVQAYGIRIQWPRPDIGQVDISKLVYFEPTRVQFEHCESIVVASHLFCMELRGVHGRFFPPETIETDPVIGPWYERRNVKLLFRFYDKWHARPRANSQVPLKGITWPSSPSNRKTLSPS